MRWAGPAYDAIGNLVETEAVNEAIEVNNEGPPVAEEPAGLAFEHIGFSVVGEEEFDCDARVESLHLW